LIGARSLYLPVLPCALLVRLVWIAYHVTMVRNGTVSLSMSLDLSSPHARSSSLLAHVAPRLLHLGWWNDAGSRPVAGVEARGCTFVAMGTWPWATDGHRATPRDGCLLTASCHDAVANLWCKSRIRLKPCPDCAGGSFTPKVGQPPRPVGVGERATSWSSCLVLGEPSKKSNAPFGFTTHVGTTCPSIMS
jgi:hypothetical protein